MLVCRNNLPVSGEALRHGLLNAQVKGRFQLMRDDMTVIVDVAHNEQSMSVLAENLSDFVVKGKLHVILGMLRDKDIENSLLAILPRVDSWHLVATPGERGLSADELSGFLDKISPGIQYNKYEKVSDAHQSVLQYAQEEDTLLVTGSFLVAGQFLEMKH